MNTKKFNKIAQSKPAKILFFVGFLFLIWFAVCLPKPLFKSPTSTVLFSEEGELLGAKIAPDGQWRFPDNHQVPDKFRQAIIEYEDQQFYYHLGVNPVAIFQALKENVKAGEIKRGGSTISQQTIRLSRNNPPRTYFEKLKEMIFAVRLELGASKKKVLSYYSSNAPFGGNVVGIDAAAWRYFGRSAEELSWAEATTLAVLPNAPGLIHPGRNREQLKQKRDDLLRRLYKKGKIDELTYENSIQEALPLKPIDLPRIAPHLLERANQEHQGQLLYSTINHEWQQAVNRIIANHHRELEQNQIHNAAAIIIDVKTKEVKAYVGNTKTTASHQHAVDMIPAARSTGSLLKPFLYAATLDEGQILPHALLPDVPTYYNNYTPKNFDETYAGAVPASTALAKSLNIPAVRLLDEFGIPKFHNKLQQMKLRDVKFKPSHYGLPLILGGAESSLWDMTKAYAAMASTLNHFNENDGSYFNHEFDQLSYNKDDEQTKKRKLNQQEVFSAASIWHTFNALIEAKRPGEQKAWEYFSTSQKLAWKTGTSFGDKDAWAIGANPNYVIGVWVGNADGEGRTGNTGLATAAPILFDIVDVLPKSNDWFTPPVEELYQAVTCKKSGMLSSSNCIEKDTILVNKVGLNTAPCSYHKLVTVTKDLSHRVNLSCEARENTVQKTYFVLPPREALFYAKKHVNYKSLPPIKTGCESEEQKQFSILYPDMNAKLSIPTNLSGKEEKIVAKVAHKKEEATLFWYLDEEYIGKTKNIHHMEMAPAKGRHLLGITDENGQQEFLYFEIE